MDGADSAGSFWCDSAASFDTPDHVGIVIHNYRWRLGLAEGEAQYDTLEQRLAKGPVIAVPSITLEGDANGAPHPPAAAYAQRFSGKYQHRELTGGIGHTCRRKHRRRSPPPFSMLVRCDGLSPRRP